MVPDSRGLATRQHIQHEFQRCRLVDTNPVPFERRDPSVPPEQIELYI
jgi:hypothetical protein